MLPTMEATKCSYCQEESECKICLKCQKPYCTKHANRVCLSFCQDCFKDVTVLIDNHFKRVDTDFSIELDKVIEHTHVCKQIKLDGPDYVWYSTAINLLDDKEFETQFEFHKFIIKLFEHLATVRKIEYETTVREKRRSEHAAKAAAALTSKAKPKVKKVKSLREILMASGLSGDALELALKTMQK